MKAIFKRLTSLTGLGHQGLRQEFRTIFFFSDDNKILFFFIYLKKQEMQSLAIHELKNWK